MYSELPPQQQAETIKSQLMDEQLQICEQYVLQSQKVFDYHRLQLMQAELIEMHGELYDMRGLIYRTKRRIRDCQYKHEHVLTNIKIWGESVKQLVSQFLNQQHQLVSFDKAPVYCYINEANSVEALSLPSA